jgi:hypothetical protein
MNLFKAGDFALTQNRVDTANLANAMLNEWLERDGVKVFGWPGYHDKNVWHPDITCYDDDPTRTAIIVNVKEIENKVACVHEPRQWQCVATGEYFFRCKKCDETIKSSGWAVE